MDNHSIKNTNSKKVHIIGTILIVLFVIFSIIMIIMTNLSKKNRSAKETDLPEEYVIQTENYFDYQEAYDCSGYSTAYVLRSLGIDVKGHELYEKIPQKFADGTVPIESIMNYLQNEDFLNMCDTGFYEKNTYITIGLKKKE